MVFLSKNKKHLMGMIYTTVLSKNNFSEDFCSIPLSLHRLARSGRRMAELCGMCVCAVCGVCVCVKCVCVCLECVCECVCVWCVCVVYVWSVCVFVKCVVFCVCVCVCVWTSKQAPGLGGCVLRP